MIVILDMLRVFIGPGLAMVRIRVCMFVIVYANASVFGQVVFEFVSWGGVRGVSAAQAICAKFVCIAHAFLLSLLPPCTVSIIDTIHLAVQLHISLFCLLRYACFRQCSSGLMSLILSIWLRDAGWICRFGAPFLGNVDVLIKSTAWLCCCCVDCERLCALMNFLLANPCTLIRAR